MRRVFLAIAILLLPCAAHGQAWSGIVASSRAIDWSSAGVPGGIPTRTVICSTISPEGTSGSPVAPTDVNSAIAACPSGEVVKLSAGNFYFSACVTWNGASNVTVRGAGADQTFVYIVGNDTCTEGLGAAFDMGNGVASYPGDTFHTTYANWTAGYSVGTSSITLSTTSGLAIGDTIILDQCDDGFSGGGSGNSTCGTGSATDTGNVWTCTVQNVCSVSPASGGGRTNRSQQQMVLVTNIVGSVVTISPGLYMPNWRTGQSPMALWPSTGTPAKGNGVENLSIDMLGESGQSQSAGVLLFGAYGSWVTGVRFVSTVRNGVWLYQAAHCTIANNYMYGTQNAVSESYGIEHFIGSDNLIENNIGQHVTTPLLANGSDAGDVWAYNFDTDNYYIGAVGWMMAGAQQHAAGTGMDLYEGNQGSGFLSDVIHGTHNLTTLFRNDYSGWQPSCDGQSCTLEVTATQNQLIGRYFNYIGNVLGTSGVHNVYITNPTSTGQAGTQGSLAIYEPGWCGQDGVNQSVCTNGNDLYTLTSIMRWGNYDVVNAAARFVNAEVPTGLSDGFANSVPSSHTLPNSFFLSGVTASTGCGTGLPFGKVFTNYPTDTTTVCSGLPLAGPDISGGNVPNVGGFANNIPAEIAYANLPVDASYGTGYTITNATWSTGTATLTVSSLPAGCTNANNGTCVEGEIRVTGMTPSGYNGTYQITASTSTTVKYAVTSNPGSFSSGGTMTWPNVRTFNASVYANDPVGYHVLTPGVTLTGGSCCELLDRLPEILP